MYDRIKPGDRIRSDRLRRIPRNYLLIRSRVRCALACKPGDACAARLERWKQGCTDGPRRSTDQNSDHAKTGPQLHTLAELRSRKPALPPKHWATIPQQKRIAHSLHDDVETTIIALLEDSHYAVTRRLERP